jgi:PPOX class probable F420-dependent enzyme
MSEHETVQFTSQQAEFLDAQRVAHLATADRSAQPHVVPVCYACDGRALYIALDEKPKRVTPERLKRVHNILENSQVALVVDHYDDNWSRLAYMLVQGRAEILQPGDVEHDRALSLVRARYPQYRSMALELRPVIAIRPTTIVAWGALTLEGESADQPDS